METGMIRNGCPRFQFWNPEFHYSLEEKKDVDTGLRKIIFSLIEMATNGSFEMPNHTDRQIANFWEKVDLPTIGLLETPDYSKCWPWKGATFHHNRAAFWFDNRVQPAARFSWELHNGTKWPDGKHSLHTCDNPSCVNPKHIYAGDQQQNMRDRSERDRTAKGEDHYKAKLTEDKVRYIRQCEPKFTYLARKFDVARCTIRSAWRGETWAHVQ